MPDGIPVTNRVDGTTERKLHSKVIQVYLNSPTYLSRLVGKGQPFEGKTMDFTLDIAGSNQFEWFTGLENLNSAAEDTTITLSYAHTAGTQPKVGIMLESFANAGQTGTIPLDAYKYEKAANELIKNLASAAYTVKSGDKPNGLNSIVDDGTNDGTIGGASRTTFSALNATYTDSNGTMSLAKLGTLDDNASVGGEVASVPNLNLTDFPTWSLYEQLLDPQVRSNYQSGGFPSMSVRGDGMISQAELGGAGGFVTVGHRGRGVIKDKYATPQSWYKLNEDTFGWFGRSIVPDDYKDTLTKVDLGQFEATEQSHDLPSSFNGFFYQKDQVLPGQAGTIGRFYVIGQICAKDPSKNAQLFDIANV